MLVASAPFALGCRGLLKKRGGFDAGSDDPLGVASATPAVKKVDDADDKLQDKINEYIRCQNSTSADGWSSMRRYASSWRDPKVGPKGNETYAYVGKLDATGVTTCQTQIPKGKTLPPKDATLETAGDAYLVSIVEVQRLTDQLYDYFENKNFKDDKWAKGKTSHPLLMNAYANFRKADHDLHSALDGITKPLSDRTLGRIEREDGKKFFWHRLHTLNTARDMLEVANPRGEENAVDITLFKTTLPDFSSSLDGLTTYGAGNKADLNDKKKSEHWPLAASNYDSFVRDANAFRAATNEFQKCLDNAGPKAKNAAGKILVDKIGTCSGNKALAVQDAVFKKYNEFIRTSNNSRFP